MTPHFVPCNHRYHLPRTRTFTGEPGNFTWVSRYLHPPHTNLHSSTQSKKLKRWCKRLPGNSAVRCTSLSQHRLQATMATDCWSEILIHPLPPGVWENLQSVQEGLKKTLRLRGTNYFLLLFLLQLDSIPLGALWILPWHGLSIKLIINIICRGATVNYLSQK